MNKVEEKIAKVEADITSVRIGTVENRAKIDKIESTVEMIDKNVKIYIDRKISSVKNTVSNLKPNLDHEYISKFLNENVKEAIDNSASDIRKEIDSIKQKTKCDEIVMENMRTVVTGVKDQLDRTLESPLNFSVRSDTTVREDNSKKVRERELTKNAIESSAKLIRQLINVRITDCSDIGLIQKSNNDVKKITGYIKTCHDLLMKYVSYDGMDADYYSTIKSLLDAANDWIISVEQIYSSSEAHASGSTRGDLSQIEKFSDNKSKSIYEFFEDLEIGLVGWGTNKQRATLIYSKYLSEDIKSKTINISDDYKKLKAWLFKEYGSPDTVISEIISGLASKRKPTPGDLRERHAFYTEITMGLARLDRLSRVPNIDIDELDTILYSKTILKDLFKLIPREDDIKFKTHMSEKKLDYKNPSGIRTFAFFKERCETERDVLEPYKGIVNPTPKPRAVHNVAQGNSPTRKEEITIHAARYSPPRVWYKPGAIFPCPLSGHSHEMYECREFFSLNPYTRWDLSGKGKICFTCLRPKNICVERKCMFQSSVPEVLSCQGCHELARERGWSPFNILFCKKRPHADTRAPYNEIKGAFDKYMGKLSNTIDDQCIKYSVNFTQQIFATSSCPDFIECVCCPKPSSLSMDTPTINSQSGVKIPTLMDTIIPEVNEHASYLLQTIKIGNANVIVFFDNGANTNLITEKIAIDQGLQLISKKPSKLTVVGGGSIQSEVGKFRFNIGPTENGDFHEIKCQGMRNITSKFPRINLSTISEEFKNSSNNLYDGEPLPEYIGGDEIGLLIGIKNARMNPTLITVLPSGVGVYKSPFADIWGSRYIFAGPHAVFSGGDPNRSDGLTHAIFHMKESTLSYRGELKEIPISIPIDKRFNITIHPTPVQEQDLIELGGELPVGHGDYISEPNPDDISINGTEAHFCGVNKVTLPIARMRELVGEDQNENLVTYKCNECAKCITCKKSPRLTAISLQESLEQSYIEKSVSIDYESKKVVVTLPFIKNPIDYLTKKHGSDSNYRQAKRIYVSQCKKSDIEREGMRKTHQELVDKGFMVKLQNLPVESQNLIKNAEFRHFYPWFIVLKEDSLSTPIRMVVDPTQTFLNVILPKGENRLGNILDLIIRSRGWEHIWSSDISKLYNQLHLDTSAYPYSLFLYNESLDPNIEPDIYVMVRAWYGVISTGSQAGFALDNLAEQGKHKYPDAKSSLDRDRYVDDILSGADTEQKRQDQIDQVQKLLETAGFNLKYLVLSGQKPDEKASSDGETIKLLGYKWNTELDILSPGIGELNVSKKKKGVKKPNPHSVTTESDAEKLLAEVKLSRRIVISKIAEIFDPVGLWEPLKLQLKLHASGLNSIPWDRPLSNENQVKWKKILKKFTRIGELTANRFPFTKNTDTDKSLRLICLSDAGKDAGGAAIYFGRLNKDGSWSTSLLCARSKLMKGTVPRNELSAIMLMSELAYIAKRALGEKVKDIIYLTDSTIALCWIHNTQIKVRAYIFTRVQATRRMIQIATGKDEIPLFHIEGKLNLADLLTKPHELEMEELSIGSQWQDGAEWMNREFDLLPILKYEDLTVSRAEDLDIREECYTEPFLIEPGVHMMNRVQIGKKAPGREKHTLIIDPVVLGWLKSLRILSYIISFPQLILHSLHKNDKVQSCLVCTKLGDFDPRDNLNDARKILFRYESKVVESSLTAGQLSKYKLIDGIYHFVGRLVKENPFRFKDLDQIPFLDTHTFSGPIPVILIDSPIIYSLIMFIHCKKIPHAGVEMTVKEVFKEVMVIGGLRRLIRRIKEDCTTCKLLERQTVEIEMSEHPSSRTLIAPPFYNMMCDIAFGFKGRAFKNSRTTLKFYALVCVCLLTGATNVLLMEGLETQDLCCALERHASRHGVPSDVYIDNGTQLMALKHVSFSIRDANAQLYDSLGIRVHVSAAKAHSERGRVERKIRSVRELLERTGINTANPLTSIQWETIFARISSDLGDLPIARGDTSTVSNVGFEILTANRLLLGRNNSRSLEGQGFNINASKIPTNILEKNRMIYHTWMQLFIDNIHMLTMRPAKWNKTSRLPVIDDIVLFTLTDCGYDKKGITWKLGQITKCENRKVEILYVSKVSKTGKPTKSKLTRSVRDVSIIFSVDELFINTTDHHESLFYALFDEK